MKLEEWEEILRKTAQDAKLSRGERTVLQETIKEAALDTGARALLRSRAFEVARGLARDGNPTGALDWLEEITKLLLPPTGDGGEVFAEVQFSPGDRKSTRLNSSHLGISYAVFCLKKKTQKHYD